MLLQPGDMLYLPPFWIHRVVAESVSISVNNWCEAEEITLLYDKILNAALPFDSNWTKSLYVTALRKFFGVLIQAVLKCDELSAFQFVQELYEQRYSPIFGKNLDETETKTAGSDDIFWSCRERNFSEVLSVEEEAMKLKAHPIVDYFGQLQQYSNEPQIRNVLLMQYLESVVEYFLGVENLHRFFYLCF